MNVLRRLLFVGVLLILPVMAFAQEATLTGTVTDSTGAVLPGVTVTAINGATGNTFDAVTDERGIYRSRYASATTSSPSNSRDSRPSAAWVCSCSWARPPTSTCRCRRRPSRRR